MAKRFSKSTEIMDELSTTCNPKIMSRCLSVPDATSLHRCLQSNHQYCTILSLNSAVGHLEACSQPWEMGFLRCMPSPFYPESVVLFQLHGGMVSHMQVLATPSSTVNNTKYLDPYHRNHISFSCLFLRQ